MTYDNGNEEASKIDELTADKLVISIEFDGNKNTIIYEKKTKE